MDKKEENLIKLKEKVAAVSKEFWNEFMDENSMANDVLDTAHNLIHLQEGLITNLEAKGKTMMQVINIYKEQTAEFLDVLQRIANASCFEEVESLAYGMINKFE